MQGYTFYLYGVEGGLLASMTASLESDQSARTRAFAVLCAYLGCDEVEIWQERRYVGQSRRPHGDFPHEDDHNSRAPRRHVGLAVARGC